MNGIDEVVFMALFLSGPVIFAIGAGHYPRSAKLWQRAAVAVVAFGGWFVVAPLLSVVFNIGIALTNDRGDVPYGVGAMASMLAIDAIVVLTWQREASDTPEAET